MAQVAAVPITKVPRHLTRPNRRPTAVTLPTARPRHRTLNRRRTAVPLTNSCRRRPPPRTANRNLTKRLRPLTNRHRSTRPDRLSQSHPPILRANTIHRRLLITVRNIDTNATFLI